MAVALSGTGGLFTRWGLMIGACRNALGIVGNSAPTPGSLWGASGPTIDSMGAAVNLINAQYASTLQGVIGNLYTGTLANYRNTPTSLCNDMVSYATNTLIQMANNDTPLASLTAQNAMALLISQMTTNSNTVTRNVPAITETAFSGLPANTGNPNWSVSILNNAGVKLEYAYAETLKALITNDSFSGATLGSEPISITGAAVDTSGTLDWAWPLGSGAINQTNIIDPLLDAQSSGNLLTNSSWTNWTGTTTPLNWHITVNAGAISKDTANTYGAATASLKFTSTGAEVPSLYQAFGTDTTQTILPSTSYLGGMIIKLSGASAAGAVALELTDGSGNVVNDNAGTANQLITTVTGKTANTWVPFNFRTPEVTPSNGYRLQYRVSTAIDTGVSLYTNYLAMAKANQLYTQGPFANAFRGSTAVIKGDSFNLAVTNTYAGLFQTGIYRLFPSIMNVLGPLPSAASGSISDSLVTC